MVLKFVFKRITSQSIFIGFQCFQQLSTLKCKLALRSLLHTTDKSTRKKKQLCEVCVDERHAMITGEICATRSYTHNEVRRTFLVVAWKWYEGHHDASASNANDRDLAKNMQVFGTSQLAAGVKDGRERLAKALKWASYLLISIRPRTQKAEDREISENMGQTRQTEYKQYKSMRRLRLAAALQYRNSPPVHKHSESESDSFKFAKVMIFLQIILRSNFSSFSAPRPSSHPM